MESDFAKLMIELHNRYGDDILLVIRDYLEGLQSTETAKKNLESDSG